MRTHIRRALIRWRARRIYRAGRPVEEVLAFLRRSRASLLESVFVWRSLTHMSLEKALETVVESDVWADERDGFWAAQEAFRLALKATADEYHEWPDGRYEAVFDLRKDENGRRWAHERA
jgi:hypothetical protein